jgi:iron(III) transport system substrate-binding protein
MLFLFATPALAQQARADWEQQWNKLIAEGRKEGKVVVLAPPDQEVRKVLPEAFKKRFGITMDYIGGRSSESGARLRTERNAGVYTVDVALSGIQSMATIFHREKMLDPVRPVLILPGVLDGSKWKRGKLWFVDPEDQYVLRLFDGISTFFFVNTKLVGPDDLKSGSDLLNSKWKGKIISADPTVPGAGSSDAARLYAQYGWDFLKKFYVDQNPTISRDRRQVTDAIVHGTHAIAFGASSDKLTQLMKEGFPLRPIDSLADLPASTSAGVGQVALLKNAPHPNAARVFINWIASKEGLEVFASARGDVTTRNDIDESSLPPAIIPVKGGEYFDTHNWEFTVTTKEQVRLRMKDILRQQ